MKKTNRVSIEKAGYSNLQPWVTTLISFYKKTVYKKQYLYSEKVKRQVLAFWRC